MAKLYLKRELPPCPDPEIYYAVRYGDKWGWKKKRGTEKKAVLNKSFQANQNNISLTSPAAKEILGKLLPFLYKLDKERRVARLGGKLMNGLNMTGQLNYWNLYGFEFQEKYTLQSMFVGAFKLELVNDHARFTCNVREYHVRPQNTLVTQFFFELILLQGAILSEHGLRVESDVSEILSFETEFNTIITLSLLLPETVPWMLILRLSCFEGKERALHPKHHRLRVIATGNGRNIENGEQLFERFL